MAALETSNQPGYTNAAVSLIVMCISWLATGLVHVFGYSHVERMYERLETARRSVTPEYVTEDYSEPEDVAEDVEEEDVEDEGEEDIEDEEEDFSDV